MIEEEPLCPECGNPLTGIRVMKDKRGKITMEFFCDEGGEDIFNFQIVTGLTDKDIGRLKEKGKAIPKEMAVRLIERKSEEQAIKDYDKRAANR
jgi:hypothetical protein